jgi:signal peptidase II
LKKNHLFLLIVIAIGALDQLSKFTIEKSVGLYQKVVCVENFFSLIHLRNRGAAFGFLAGFDSRLVLVFFIVLTLIAMAAILFLFIHLPQRQYVSEIALSLIFAGALGNFIDRIRIGEVVDFLDFHWYQYHWPTFNIADSSITVGVVLYILNLLYSK